MPEVIYEIVPHDGGYAYKVDDVLSESYPTREAAEAAARDAARRQRLPDQEAEPGQTIEYQDETGRWRAERTGPDDRPETDVVGRGDD